MNIKINTAKVGVIGLGYVGLPVALAFAKKFEWVVGFDIDIKKLDSLRKGIDPNGDIEPDELAGSTLKYSSNPTDLRGANFFVVGVPTPIDQNNNPDLFALKMASETVGRAISPGAIVVFESTVYPGVTEEFCGPIIAEVSGLTQGKDFKLGYSPERINPGDKLHRLEKVIKVVSGEDEKTLEKVAEIYSEIIDVGVHKAPSIKVAEAAKVIENTQRDLNIALMNELSIIFDRMNISTRDVLEAAGTKWNFLRFSPGLVGGHCIGVDPYYLTTKAEQLGIHPQVILAGRRINDGMGIYVAQKFIKLMVQAGMQVKGARVGLLGVTFKENVADIRNSRVPDIIKELKAFGIIPIIHDPFASKEAAWHEYQIELSDLKEFSNLDGVIAAVAHDAYKKLAPSDLTGMMKPEGVLVDVKSLFVSSDFNKNITYWSL